MSLVIDEKKLGDEANEAVDNAGSELRQSIDRAAMHLAPILDLAAALNGGKKIVITITLE